MEDIILSMRECILRANKAIKEIYERGFDVQIKSDDSPVTDADMESNRIIRSILNKYQDIGFLSEEEADDMSRLKKDMLFIVDPLDGTQDFVNHDDSFGVNLALVKDKKPIIAFIGFPYYQTYCYAIKGKGSFFVDANGKETRLHTSDRLSNLVFLSSKTHELDEERAVINRHSDLIKTVRYEGASIKAYLLAKGEGDVSVRYTKMTKEWDVCAPDLVVKEAGGIFVDTNLKEFVYNREDVYNHDGYCMFNRGENEVILK